MQQYLTLPISYLLASYFLIPYPLIPVPTERRCKCSTLSRHKLLCKCATLTTLHYALCSLHYALCLFRQSGAASVAHPQDTSYSAGVPHSPLSNFSLLFALCCTMLYAVSPKLTSFQIHDTAMAAHPGKGLLYRVRCHRVHTYIRLSHPPSAIACQRYP